MVKSFLNNANVNHSGVADLKHDYAPQPPTLGEQDVFKSPKIGGFRGL